VIPSPRPPEAPVEAPSHRGTERTAWRWFAVATLVVPAALLVTADTVTDVAMAATTALVLLTITLRVRHLVRDLEGTRASDVADQRERDRRRFEALVRHTEDVLLVLDRAGTVTYASPSALGLFLTDPTGWSRDDLVGLLHADEREATAAALDERLATADGRSIRLNARFVDRADGRPQHGELVAVDLRDDPDVAGVVLTIHETTQRAELEAELRHLAFHDALTGLPNRWLFQDRLSQALSRAARTGRRVAVLLADLDDFKDVNDTLGHPVGDQLLQVVAARLETSLRATDTVARLGGDEFAVLCEDLDASRDAVLAARRVLAVTDDIVEVDGQQLRVGMSVGIAVDTGERNADELLRDADIALYEAKAQGKQRWSLHRATMTARTQARLQLAADLARAVADDTLEVAYQPIHRLDDGAIVGVEALARWDHLELGPVPAEEFIALAEQNGLILRLGHRVLNRALGDLAAWYARRPDLDLRMGVNISARQLRDPKLVARVGAALDRHEIPPERLVLELTESVMLSDPDQAMQVMRELRGRGVRFAVDDFGTGYSSLAYLRQLPVDIVKIDRTFIRDLTTDLGSRDLVRAIIDLGRGMSLDVLAEGVETDAQRRILRDMGCDFAQGFHFDRPLCPGVMARRLGGSATRAGATRAEAPRSPDVLRPTGSDA
jgi:diguanylate cyclase (GGDEF)-like protein/PAS domain S-box-containing protein